MDRLEKLQIRQVDEALSLLSRLGEHEPPREGWIITIRQILGMSNRAVQDRCGECGVFSERLRPDEFAIVDRTSGMIDRVPDGATPLDEDEAAHLLPAHIRTQEPLNVWEQENILIAAGWMHRTRKPALDESFIRELHRRMFDRTWKWAGQYRTSGKNIGVSWHQIAPDFRNLIDDGKYWIDQGTYPIDEAVLRLHHRLVLIHPFPNGNGRHARLWCDTILRQNGRPPFIWKNHELSQEGQARRA